MIPAEAAALGRERATATIREKWRVRREALARIGEKTCKRCNARKPLFAFRRMLKRSGNYAYCQHCTPCENTISVERRRKREQAGRKRDRVKDAIRRAAVRGTPYISPQERRRIAEERKRERMLARALKPQRVPIQAPLLARLKAERPDLYDPRLRINTLVYRARYEFDAEYRAKEIERVRRKKALLHGIKMESDGTLRGPVVRALFAAAKRCKVCRRKMGSKDKNLDHIVPLSKGGAHSIMNVRVICKTCNTAKGAKLPDQLTFYVVSHTR